MNATPPAVVAARSVEPARGALLGAIDAGALGVTLCEIGNGVRMITPPVAGIAAFFVLGGTLKLHSNSGDTRARSGPLVSAAWATQLSPAGTAPQDRVVDGAAIAARRQGWLVADTRHGGEAAVTVAAGRVGGTTQATLSAPTVLTLATDRCARQALAPARARMFRKVRTELVRSIAREPVGA